MPPKVNNDKILAKLDVIMTQLAGLESVPKRLEALEKELKQANETNKQLATTIKEKDAEINSLKMKVNNIEQYNRSWSIRINELPIPAAEEMNPIKVMERVYNEVLAPVLKGALEQGAIPSVPPVFELLETAHVLPAPKGKIKPVIVRFRTRLHKGLMFQLKRDHAPRIAGSSSGAASSAGSSTRYKYPYYEDLTHDTFNKMREIARSDKVSACWSVGGNLRYKLVGGTEVFRVKSVNDDINTIIK
jgi:hypothetical protein